MFSNVNVKIGSFLVWSFGWCFQADDNRCQKSVHSKIGVRSSISAHKNPFV